MLLAIGCSKDIKTIDPSIAQSDEIGIRHNEMLDNVLQRLNALPKTRSGAIDVPAEELRQIAYECCCETLDTYDDLTVNQLDTAKTIMHRILFEGLDESETWSYPDATETAQALLSQLEIIMSDNDFSLPSLTSRIENIEARALDLLSEEERHTILTATSVAKYTLVYWHDNHDDWIAISDSPATRAGGFSWKQLGKEDVKGGFTAVAGWGIGVAIAGGPLGWKVVAGVAVGGAVAGSIGDAIDQLWKVSYVGDPKIT